jgi:two-component SAPR family response regulator
LFHGPVARSDLSVIFWPDFDDKQVRDHFHTSLYRARKALGETVIVFKDDQYQINPSINIWCDAMEFEGYIEQARLLPPREARTEDLWYRALKIYKGPFLNSIDQEWAFIIRERLEMAYIDALKGYGDCAFHRGDYRLAEEYFQKALQHEPYREDLHRSMLISIYNRGAAKQLVDYYERTDRNFKSELGFGLSAQTRSFYENLLA